MGRLQWLLQIGKCRQVVMTQMRLALEIGEMIWKIHLDCEGVKNVTKRDISFTGREKKWDEKEKNSIYKKKCD